jgi:hypothetical protein
LESALSITPPANRQAAVFSAVAGWFLVPKECLGRRFISPTVKIKLVTNHNMMDQVMMF